MVAEFSHRFPTMSPQNMQMFIMAETAEKNVTMSVSLIIGEIQI